MKNIVMCLIENRQKSLKNQRTTTRTLDSSGKREERDENAIQLNEAKRKEKTKKNFAKENLVI